MGPISWKHKETLGPILPLSFHDCAEAGVQEGVEEALSSFGLEVINPLGGAR